MCMSFIHSELVNRTLLTHGVKSDALHIYILLPTIKTFYAEFSTGLVFCDWRFCVVFHHVTINLSYIEIIHTFFGSNSQASKWSTQYKLSNEMCGTRITLMGERWGRFWWGILKQRDHLGDLGLDGKKEWFLKKSVAPHQPPGGGRD